MTEKENQIDQLQEKLREIQKTQKKEIRDKYDYI